MEIGLKIINKGVCSITVNMYSRCSINTDSMKVPKNGIKTCYFHKQKENHFTNELLQSSVKEQSKVDFSMSKLKAAAVNDLK